MSKEARKLALEALKQIDEAMPFPVAKLAQAALREALAQPQQEPVAWAIFTNAGNARMWSTFQPHLQKLADDEGLTITPLYTSPPAQEFVCSTGLCHYRKPLPDEQVLDCWKQAYDPGRREHDNATRMARAIEAAHGIKEQP